VGFVVSRIIKFNRGFTAHDGVLILMLGELHVENAVRHGV
jgi:hypothetical protein